jgi:hypothetical protein
MSVPSDWTMTFAGNHSISFTVKDLLPLIQWL